MKVPRPVLKGPRPGNGPGLPDDQDANPGPDRVPGSARGARAVVVVADAGMLSAANLLALEENGFEFIVGSRISKAPYDLAELFDKRGNNFTDGQTIEAVRTMRVGKGARDRRVVYQWSFKRLHAQLADLPWQQVPPAICPQD